MNRNQNSIFTRARRVIAVGIKFVTIIDTIPKLKKLFTKLTDQMSGSSDLKDDQALNIKGYAVKKSGFKVDSIKQAVKIAGIIKVFAKDTGNDVLEQIMSLVKTSFEVKDELCLSLLRSVQSAFEDNKVELKEYGLNDELLASYSGNVDAFEAELNGPATARGHKHYDTEELGTGLEATVVVLDDIESLMESQEGVNPEFYIEFQSANKKGVLGGHKHRDPKIPIGYFVVILRNKITGDIIFEGLVKIVGEEEVYPTTKTGTQVIESEQGVITCKATAIDFEPANFTVNVTDVQQTITILLTPLA